jgi:hypothetical protein
MQRKPVHFAIGLLLASALGAPLSFAADIIVSAAESVSIRSMPR